LGWYLLLVQLLETVAFPEALPVGDLSHIIRRKKSQIAADAHPEKLE
jgi:hypothetical protein